MRVVLLCGQRRSYGLDIWTSMCSDKYGNLCFIGHKAFVGRSKESRRYEEDTNFFPHIQMHSIANIVVGCI
jgi:hypothetical protein